MPPKDRWASRNVLKDDTAASAYPVVEAEPGLELTHRPSRTRGKVVAFTEGERVILLDQDGNQHEFKPHPGVMLLKGRPVNLVPSSATSKRTVTFTPSGSIDAVQSRARQAAASRIWVEGVHDAELIEKIWGDDLRVEGIVVEPMHGVDQMVGMIQEFDPQPNRRLGILLDHMVKGTKEWRSAAGISDPNVLILGHPYVDIWAAVRPQLLGIDDWPQVPRDQSWKAGVIAALGSSSDPGPFWQEVLDRVSSYKDVATPLITAIEQLIDFVAGGQQDLGC